jgi:protein-glucosylgalactosylhydroxylysine glucosidase
MDSPGVDTNLARRRYYGTDPHLMAITAARLGRSEDAVRFVLLDSDENRFSVMGHQLNFGKVGGYLPGNGALLHAVAAMAAGFESSGDPSTQSPGFPAAWRVQHENLVQLA